jgi:hypothetical protein
VPQTKPLVAASLRNIVIAVFHGSLYYRMRSDAIQSRLSLLFFAIMLVMMSNQQFIPKYVLRTSSTQRPPTI